MLIGVPRLSVVAYCPADAGQARADALAKWVADSYHGALDQCSPDLYWLQGDHMVQVRVALATPPTAVLPAGLKPQPRRTWLRHLRAVAICLVTG